MRVLIGALLLGVCGWQTHRRAEEWRTDQALWSAAHQTAPGLARPLSNLGIAEIGQGQWTSATTHLIAALRAFAPDPELRVRTQRALTFIAVVSPSVGSSP